MLPMADPINLFSLKAQSLLQSTFESHWSDNFVQLTSRVELFDWQRVLKSYTSMQCQDSNLCRKHLASPNRSLCRESQDLSSLASVKGTFVLKLAKFLTKTRDNTEWSLFLQSLMVDLSSARGQTANLRSRTSLGWPPRCDWACREKNQKFSFQMTSFQNLGFRVFSAENNFRIFFSKETFFSVFFLIRNFELVFFRSYQTIECHWFERS